MSEPYAGFREFVAARSGALARTAYLLTGDAHAAKDLLQEALTRVAGRWRRIVASGDPEAYVRRVLYTTHVSWWRRRTSQSELSRRRDRPAPLDVAEVVARRMLMASALAKLTPKQRAVLVLRFYEDLTEASTAAVLGVSVSTVKSQTAYALARLRDVAGVDIADLRGRPPPAPRAGRATSPGDRIEVRP